MAKIARKLTDLVGNTPLMELSGYSGKYGLEQNIIAKLEAFNPAGSVKDRVALSMIEDAEARGTLKPGATLEYNTVPASVTSLAFLRNGEKTTLNLVDEGAIWTVSEAVAITNSKSVIFLIVCRISYTT